MRKYIKVTQPILHIKIRHTVRIDRIAQRNIGVDLHPFLGVEAHLLVCRTPFVQVVRPLHRLHKRWELNNLTPQRAVEDPSSPYWNLRRPTLRAAQHNLHANISRADSCNGGDVVEEDNRSNQQADDNSTNLDELQWESPGIIIPAIAGIQYFTKERHLHPPDLSKRNKAACCCRQQQAHAPQNSP